MATVHILSQYIWPDAAPTGWYAEQLAIRLGELGCRVRLIGGKGAYRELQRAQPDVAITHLDHWRGRRGNLLETFAEYASVTRAFENYIIGEVGAGDVVIVTSAPPNTVRLAHSIERRGARSVYWLQDYYPELIRGLRDYPVMLRRSFRRLWDRKLARWDSVVKIAANLGGPESNSSVIRLWPTLQFDQTIAPEPRTALYSGNLGYGHHVGLLVEACEKLRDDGFRISIRADGPGVRRLPGWLKAQPLIGNSEEFREALLRHKVHLVAAHPGITQAVFPSKIWNSLAAHRRIICTGFARGMVDELKVVRKADFSRHLDQWTALILPMMGISHPTFAAAA